MAGVLVLRYRWDNWGALGRAISYFGGFPRCCSGSAVVRYLGYRLRQFCLSIHLTLRWNRRRFSASGLSKGVCGCLIAFVGCAYLPRAHVPRMKRQRSNLPLQRDAAPASRLRAPELGRWTAK